jgi:hypothetical protein
MSYQGRLPIKRFIAFSAPLWSIVGMRTYMTSQVLFMLKRFMAKVALERLDSCMHVHMASQVGHLSEHPIA